MFTNSIVNISRVHVFGENPALVNNSYDSKGVKSTCHRVMEALQYSTSLVPCGEVGDLGPV